MPKSHTAATGFLRLSSTMLCGYLRFTLSYRDVEELLAESGLDIPYESVRSWVLKFGPTIARRLRQARPRASDRWLLDEMVVRIASKTCISGDAVEQEGEILDVWVQRRRDRRAAVKLMRKLLRKQDFAPKTVTTDKLRSYSAAFRHLGLSCQHEQRLRRRVDDWRGSLRLVRLYCYRQLSPVPVSQFAP
jgi:putative transposase